VRGHDESGCTHSGKEKPRALPRAEHVCNRSPEAHNERHDCEGALKMLNMCGQIEARRATPTAAVRGCEGRRTRASDEREGKAGDVDSWSVASCELGCVR
jgi:hypothetical protein